MNSNIKLISTRELAVSFGYDSPSPAFYEFCRRVGILPVPGRRGWYDPKLVRAKLDIAQGIQASVVAYQEAPPISLVAQRRARLAQK